jgi:hypothetical protein
MTPPNKSGDDTLRERVKYYKELRWNVFARLVRATPGKVARVAYRPIVRPLILIIVYPALLVAVRRKIFRKWVSIKVWIQDNEDTTIL